MHQPPHALTVYCQNVNLNVDPCHPAPLHPCISTNVMNHPQTIWFTSYSLWPVVWHFEVMNEQCSLALAIVTKMYIWPNFCIRTIRRYHYQHQPNMKSTKLWRNENPLSTTLMWNNGKTQYRVLFGTDYKIRRKHLSCSRIYSTELRRRIDGLFIFLIAIGCKQSRWSGVGWFYQELIFEISH